MDDGDLSRVYERLSVEAHHLDHSCLILEAFHIVKVCEHCVPALNACRSRRHDHVLSRSHELHSGSCDRCLEVLCVISAR